MPPADPARAPAITQHHARQAAAILLRTATRPQAEEAPASPAGQAQLAQAMANFAASTYILYHKTLYHSWCAGGPGFAAQIRLFEGYCRHLLDAAGRVSRRVRAMGYACPGTLSDFIAASSVREDPLQQSESDLARLNRLKDGHATCLGEATRIAAMARGLQDRLTAELAAQEVMFHENALREIDGILYA